jgi:hypothetical protein
MLKIGIRLMMISLAITALTVAADAKKGGGGGGHGGGGASMARGGGHGGGGFRAPSSSRSFAIKSSRTIRSSRAAGGRSAVRGSRSSIARSGAARVAKTSTAKIGSASFKPAGSGFFHRRTFHRHFFGGFFIGWYGPLFWPYAYYDVFGYAFWPYGPYWYSDPFWSYGYVDIYGGIFSPYVYDDFAGPARRAPRGVTASRRDAISTTQLNEMCGQDTRDIAGLPIDKIQQAVEPDQTQRSLLDALGNASINASQVVKAACPTQISLTPTGRLDAMEKRLTAMAQAIQIMRTPLENFYSSLTDEQKARFNAIGNENAPRASKDQGRQLAQPCGDLPPGVAEWPAADIERAIQPTETQRANLDALKDTAVRAADMIKASCPAMPPVTPPARLAAIEQRIQILITATMSVRAALDTFYSSLGDEQKARFNTIGRQVAKRT